MRQRFIRRTWRRTSDMICKVNEFPPGFRIVLLDKDGRVKRDDLVVRSGDFSVFPNWMPVAVFLGEVMKNVVKDTESLGYDTIELRTHRDEPVGGSMELRRVRDMPGAGGAHAEAYEQNLEMISDLECEIETALTIFDDDLRFASGTGSSC